MRAACFAFYLVMQHKSIMQVITKCSYLLYLSFNTMTLLLERQRKHLSCKAGFTLWMHAAACDLMQAAYDVHPGVDALHAASVRLHYARKIFRERTCSFWAYFSRRIFLYVMQYSRSRAEIGCRKRVRFLLMSHSM